MTEVYRQDVFHFDAASGFDPQTGLFRGEGTLARVGVFKYLRQDGSVQAEFVPPEELHDPAWLRSCQMAPVTLHHPEQLVTETTADEVIVGQLGETITKLPDRIKAPIGVHKKRALDAMRAGVQQLSCGYTTVLVPRSGEYQGMRYDVVQTQRRCNHVAIVPQGRHGPEVRIKMDGAAHMVAPVTDDQPGPEPGTRSKIMALVNLGRMTVDVADAGVASAISARLDDLQRQTDAALETARAEKARADRAEGERDAAKTRADAAETAKTDAEKQAEQKVRARMDLEDRARKVLGPDAKFDGQTDDQVRTAALKKLDSTFDAAGKSGEYLAGRFDTALETHERANAPVASLRRDVAPPAGGTTQTVQLDSAELRAAAVLHARLRSQGVDVTKLAGQ